MDGTPTPAGAPPPPSAARMLEGLADEVFGSGSGAEWQAEFLLILATFLKLPRADAIQVVHRAQERSAGHRPEEVRPLNPISLFTRLLEFVFQSRELDPEQIMMLAELRRLFRIPESLYEELLARLKPGRAPGGAELQDPGLASTRRASDSPSFVSRDSRNPKTEAELLLSLRDAERLGAHPPRVTLCLDNLANFYMENNSVARAEPLLRRSLILKEEVLGRDHAGLAGPLNRYALALRELGQVEEAEGFEVRAREILASRNITGVGSTLKIRNSTRRAKALLPGILHSIERDLKEVFLARARLNSRVQVPANGDDRETVRIDLRGGTFVSREEGRPATQGQVQVVGSHVAQHQAWLWAWLNPQIPPPLTTMVHEFISRSGVLRELGNCSMFEADHDACQLIADWIAWRIHGLASFPVRRGKATTYVILKFAPDPPGVRP